MWDLSRPGIKSVSPGSNLLLEDLPEEDMATYSSILTRISWTEEPGRESMGSQRVGHHWSDLACTEARMTSHSSIYQNFFCYTQYWCSKARSQQTILWGHNVRTPPCVFVHGSQMSIWSHEIQKNIYNWSMTRNTNFKSPWSKVLVLLQNSICLISKIVLKELLLNYYIFNFLHEKCIFSWKWKCSCSVVVTPWTVARQAPLSNEFSKQEYWSGLPFPSPGDLPDPGIEPGSSTLWTNSLLSEPPGKPLLLLHKYIHS